MAAEKETALISKFYFAKSRIFFFVSVFVCSALFSGCAHLSERSPSSSESSSSENSFVKNPPDHLCGAIIYGPNAPQIAQTAQDLAKTVVDDLNDDVLGFISKLLQGLFVLLVELFRFELSKVHDLNQALMDSRSNVCFTIGFLVQF